MYNMWRLYQYLNYHSIESTDNFSLWTCSVESKTYLKHDFGIKYNGGHFKFKSKYWIQIQQYLMSGNSFSFV